MRGGSWKEHQPINYSYYCVLPALPWSDHKDKNKKGILEFSSALPDGPTTKKGLLPY